MTEKDINKKFGFYGTVKSTVGSTQATKKIWDAMVTRLVQMYPEKPIQEIYEFLNSRTGRHFADHLLDMCGMKPHTPLIIMRIAMLNKMKMAHWWAHFYDVIPPTNPIEYRFLYKLAIKKYICKDDIKEAVKHLLACDLMTPEEWLEAVTTTEEELKMVWGYLQSKFQLNQKRI